MKQLLKKDAVGVCSSACPFAQNQPLLEDLSVQQALVAMEMSEKVDWSQPDQRKQVVVLWQEFANNILYHSFHRFITFSQILQKLGEKVIACYILTCVWGTEMGDGLTGNIK